MNKPHKPPIITTSNMDVPESQNSRDARIEQLWLKLDPEKKGELDLQGLQKGLSRIDHPLKNANELLKEVIKSMDKNGDEVIQYEEFRTFVEQTEKELLALFISIDRDQNGKVDKSDLRAAFKTSGLAVPDSKLDQFFSEVDHNHDGFITFSEWRNFLLFIPTHTGPPLKAVLSYYSSALKLNSEGDTSISEDTLEGLGTAPLLLNVLFGAIIKLAQPIPSKPTPNFIGYPVDSSANIIEMAATASNPVAVTDEFARENSINQHVKEAHTTTPDDQDHQMMDRDITEILADMRKNFSLTDCLPDSGYFIAGAVAGVVSRTATAPLDRLKVYLIANVGDGKSPAAVAKEAGIKAAGRTLGKPLIDASLDLWRSGGFRNLFVGNGLNVLKVMPESAIKFGFYEFAKRGFAQMEGHADPKNISPISKFLAGGFGGTISQLFVYPLDTLKFRMQCESVKGGPRGGALISSTFKGMCRQGLIKTSYRGLSMGLLGMFPYAAIDLSTFEYLKGVLTRHNARVLGCDENDALPGALATGAIGACSGSFGATVVYPINLLRTRLQAQGTVLHPPTYTGIWDVFRTTVKNEGTRGLFKGLTPNLLKVVPAVSITYVAYENTKKVLNLH